MPERDQSGLTFGKDVSPGETSQLTYDVDEAIRIDKLDVYVYGNETLLKLNPVVKVGRNSEIPLVETIGDSQLDGHHAEYHWQLSEELEEGDQIIVKYDNQDTSNSHRFRVNMDISSEDMGAIFT